MKKSLIVLASLTVALGACSSSDGDDASSDNGGEDSGNEFCQKFMELDSLENQPETQEETISAFDDLIDAAPDEIRDDLETVRDAFAGLEDFDDAEANPEAAQEFLDVLSQPEIVEASANLEAYTVDVCGIEPEPVVTAVGAPASESSVPDQIEE